MGIVRGMDGTGRGAEMKEKEKEKEKEKKEEAGTGLFGSEPERIKAALREGRVTLAVYGMGRVGTPIAVAWLRAGARAIGVDINAELVEGLNRGEPPFDDEPGIREGIRRGVAEGRFYATSDGVEASRRSDVKIVVIPTVLDERKRLNNANLESVLRSIGRGLKAGDLVIIECTVPPLTTEVFARRILEEESGLVAERDFGLAYSPERIYEGRALQDIEVNYPKVVGGVSGRSTEAVAALYEVIARKGVIRLPGAKEAEASKVFEGIYRDVNIALANEFAKFCDRAGIDFAEARTAANSQPFCHIHMPGIGVGGLCIPVYPYFLIEVAKGAGLDLRLTKQAREVNEGMPGYTLQLLEGILKGAGVSLKGAKVGVLGLTFRGDVKDIRFSPAVDFINLLAGRAGEVRAYDPLVRCAGDIKGCERLEEVVEWADALVIATEHGEFRNLDLRRYKTSKRLVIVDGRNVLDRSKLPESAVYVGIGRPVRRQAGADRA